MIMNHKLYIIVALLITTISSCKHKEKLYIVDSFPVEETLTGEVISSFNSDIGILGIKQAGEYVICDMWKQDYFFNVYDAENRLAGKLCMKGNGPDEFLAPAYYGQYDSECVWILERARELFFKVNLHKSLAQGKTVIEERFNLSKYPGLQSRNLFYINDELFFGTNDNTSCATFTLNPKTSEIKFNPHVLDFPISSVTHQISQSMATLKPDRKLVATSFFYLPQIDIYSSEGKRLKTIFYKKVVEPATLDVFQGLQDYYIQVFSTDEYIYALYTEPLDYETIGHYIQVFDWDGNPVASLNVGPTTDFYVTRNNKKLVALDFNAETDNVKSYDISFLN